MLYSSWIFDFILVEFYLWTLSFNSSNVLRTFRRILFFRIEAMRTSFFFHQFCLLEKSKRRTKCQHFAFFAWIKITNILLKQNSETKSNRFKVSNDWKFFFPVKWIGLVCNHQRFVLHIGKKTKLDTKKYLYKYQYFSISIQYFLVLEN